MFSTSTYRAISQCKGVVGGSTIKAESNLHSAFTRSVLSPDGRYAMGGVMQDGNYEIRIWEFFCKIIPAN